MATKTRNEYMNDFISELRENLCITSATLDVPIPFEETCILRGQFELPKNIPNLVLYIYEKEEAVERRNQYSRRELPLSVECYFSPLNLFTSLSADNGSEVANIILRELQIAINKTLFAKNPAIEIGNELYYTVMEKNRMAIRIDILVSYVTDY